MKTTHSIRRITDGRANERGDCVAAKQSELIPIRSCIEAKKSSAQVIARAEKIFD
jgi:hypothetical protein